MGASELKEEPLSKSKFILKVRVLGGVDFHYNFHQLVVDICPITSVSIIMDFMFLMIDGRRFSERESVFRWISGLLSHHGQLLLFFDQECCYIMAMLAMELISFISDFTQVSYWKAQRSNKVTIIFEERLVNHQFEG